MPLVPIFAITIIVLSAPLSILGCDAGDRQSIAQLDTADGSALCLPSPDRCDDEGAIACSGTGLRTCRDLGGCLVWGPPIGCPPNETCADGACQPACPGATCDTPDARRCDPQSARAVERCADADGDGCFGWEPAETCDAVCSQGRCEAACADECSTGFVRCDGDSVVTCDDHDADGCREWGGAKACPDTCALGACVSGCVAECAAEGLTRCDSAQVETCREVDGCLRWVASVTCPEGTTCSAGRCSSECVDECQMGETTCQGGGRVECGEFDADACRDWSLPTACAAGETCSAGACSSMCENECTTEGARDCDSTGHDVVVCGQHDADPCLEFAEVQACDTGEACSLGACRTECVDECTADARQCRPGSGTSVEVCGNSDSDPCLEWVASTDCAATNRVCANGACAAQCADECGGPTCDGNAVVPCGDFDGDACADRGSPVQCAVTEACEAGACKALEPPSGVKISEVLYRSAGPDEDVFIELSGPPGASLRGLELVAINGSDGQVYGRLALVGAFDADGLFVVAHPDAAPFIADWADQRSTFADLQNAPDNVTVNWGERTLDALGYGVFAGRDVFRGEGSPAPAVDDGVSLARLFLAGPVDTDNNALDFQPTHAPNPGRLGSAPRTPEAGEVIFTEFMIDANALSDAQGEWIELWNTTPHTLELGGCVMESDMAEVWTLPSIRVAPFGYVVLARSNNPGFTPTAVWSGLTLSNDGDAIALICGDFYVDLVTWEDSTSGKSMSLDPSYADGDLNDIAEAWCVSPVPSVVGRDAGTPGLPNPPCP
jgi:hypothetical protein